MHRFIPFSLMAVLPLWGGSLFVPWARAQGANAPDAQVQAEAEHALHGKRFSGIHVSVSNGAVTLTGDVDRYNAKMDAEKKIQHIRDVSSVRDLIRVDTANVSDEELTQKLSKGLTYDRVGYGTTVFNSITLQVKDGIVLVGGMVYGPPDKSSALDLIANTPGVRGIIDHITVDPLSPLDDRIRRDEERAIYGAPQLNRYALNPAKPIRIVVQNGHVTLTGVVDDEGDKNVAGIRANGVPGVFSVVNDLQVAGQNPER